MQCRLPASDGFPRQSGHRRVRRAHHSISTLSTHPSNSLICALFSVHAEQAFLYSQSCWSERLFAAWGLDRLLPGYPSDQTTYCITWSSLFAYKNMSYRINELKYCGNEQGECYSTRNFNGPILASTYGSSTFTAP